MGLEERDLRRRAAALDRARDTALRRAPARDNLGGVAVVWHRRGDAIISEKLAIQPGVADDVPSLLTALSREVGWPGAAPTDGTYPPETAVAAWARVWQVCDAADLRVLLRWDADGAFHGTAALWPLEGEPRPLLDTAAFSRQLDDVARAPRGSASPHGLLLAGNAAMRDGDYARARDAYARAADALPAHLEAHRNLALARARLGEWEAAAAAMRAALALGGADPALAHEYLALETDAGVAAAQQGDLEQAAAHFLRILERWPDEPTALANLGNLRLREGRRNEARAIFRRFLTHHPDHPAAAKVRLALREVE